MLAGCSNSLIPISKIMLFVLFSTVILCGNSNSWPSGLRCCDRNRKMPALNSTGSSTWLRDPNLLRGSRWPSARNLTIAVINIGCVRFSSRQWVKVGRGADKKKLCSNMEDKLILCFPLSVQQLQFFLKHQNKKRVGQLLFALISFSSSTYKKLKIIPE